MAGRAVDRRAINAREPPGGLPEARDYDRKDRPWRFRAMNDRSQGPVRVFAPRG